MRLKRTALFFICCLLFGKHYAQPGQYLFSHIDVTSGLSNNHINSIYKDAKGFMWFGTISGLNRYDGYQFRVFRHNAQDTTTLSDNYVDRIFEDFNGMLWLETKAGWNIYDPKQSKIKRNTGSYLHKNNLPEAGLTNIVQTGNAFWMLYSTTGIFKRTGDGKTIFIGPRLNDSTALDASPIADIKADSKGNIWLIHINGLLEKIDGVTNTVTYKKFLQQHPADNSFKVCKIFIDSQDDLWLYADMGFDGVYYHRPGSGIVKSFTQESAEAKLSSNTVFSIIEDEKGLIWISTDHGGVNVIDKRDFSVTNISRNNDDFRSLSENSIGPMYKDKLGIIWLGTFKNGVDYYQPNAIRFPHYRRQAYDPASLPFDDINSFTEDKSGNLWMGTNGGGLIYFNRKENTFKLWKHENNNTNSLSSDIIVSMCLDHENKLWIGTYNGGLDCFDGKTFIHYRHNAAIPGSLSDDRVMSLFEDASHTIWAGTLSGGLNKLIGRSQSFIQFRENEPNALLNNYIAAITEDANKNLWVGTAYGIAVMEKSTGKFKYYLTDNSRLSNNNIVCIYSDSRGKIWVGTREGLNLWNPDKKIFQPFYLEDGLAANTIRAIIEDNRQNIWVSTSNGLSKIALKKGNSTYQISSKNYDELDGLQSKDFNNNAGIILKNGELVFGGPKGFNLFNPENIKTNGIAPQVVITDLQVLNKPVVAGEPIGEHIILKAAISETKEFTLKHSENVFSISFASLNFTNTIKNKYAYKLEGFNKEWQYTDSKFRTATYTNLDHGEYILRVKAANEDGVWNEAGITLKIIVLPPFWKTGIAYFLYALLAIGILYAARRLVIRRAKMRFEIEQERLETQRLHELDMMEIQRMHELDMMKIRFFTNLSHELRTPISLILAPVDKLLKESLQPDKKPFELIKKNARRLLNLVNQLLDFRKLETKELKLQTSEGDLVKFVREIFLSFTDLAESKNISFLFQPEIERFYTSFDKDKIERIIFNLLSNAFKFTPEEGEVSITLFESISDADNPGVIVLRITDTGIGIAPDKLEKIFERFFQSETPNTILNQGSGIGLAITKEFVKMHQGTLAVKSELNVGSSFTITFPFHQIPALQIVATDNAEAGETEYIEIVASEEEEHSSSVENAVVWDGIKKPVVLLVEDNEDFLFYLKENLRTHFEIIEARNGKAGWQKALALHPQMIVSDISMPVMDGIELCQKIKNDERTRYIPVILLTAFAGEDQQLRGLGTGASDYLTKPFNFEILLSKIRNLLNYQATIKKTYQKQVQASPAAIEAESQDDDFIKKVLAAIEENMNNPDFSVEELSHLLYVSRGTMYKRIHVLTGKSPIEFIRQIRLKRAAMLLEKSQRTVAEIALTVGINNPKYFARYFKIEFGIIPSAYRQQYSSRKTTDAAEVIEKE